MDSINDPVMNADFIISVHDLESDSPAGVLNIIFCHRVEHVCD